MLNPIILIRSKFENMKNTPTSPYWPTVLYHIQLEPNIRNSKNQEDRKVVTMLKIARVWSQLSMHSSALLSEVTIEL